MVRTIRYCHLCDYKSDRRYDRDKHVQRKHATQSNSSLGAYGRASAAMKHEINAPVPQVGYYSATEMDRYLPLSYQHVSNYQDPYIKHPSKAQSIQQYDSRALPTIQYNEVNQQRSGLQTSTNYSVTQNNETDDEIDVEDEEYPNDDLKILVTL